MYCQTHGRKRLETHTIAVAWKPESKSCYEITLEARKVQWKDTSLSAPVALPVNSMTFVQSFEQIYFTAITE